MGNQPNSWWQVTSRPCCKKEKVPKFKEGKAIEGIDNLAGYKEISKTWNPTMEYSRDHKVGGTPGWWIHGANQSGAIIDLERRSAVGLTVLATLLIGGIVYARNWVKLEPTIPQQQAELSAPGKVKVNDEK